MLQYTIAYSGIAAHPEGGKKGENLKYQTLDARIILKWIFKKQDERIWNGFSRFVIRTRQKW